MRKVVFVFLSAIYFTTNLACKHDAEIEDTVFVIVPYASIKHIIPANAKPADLTVTEELTIDSLLSDAISKYDTEQKTLYIDQYKFDSNISYNLGRVLINLGKYKRQYAVYINDKGEKEVYINCMRGYGSSIPSKKVWAQVCDGGNSFFKIHVNLTKKIFYDLAVNGET